MLMCNQKKNQPVKGNRFLISITFLGSAGPIRLVVNEDDPVATVIDTALKSYAREKRLPVLGSDLNNFILYCPVTGTDALSPWDTIGSVGARNFMLYKKPHTEDAIDGKESPATPWKNAGKWKAWLHKSINLKISSH